MSEYFYITFKKNGKVLDCDSLSRPAKLGTLVTRKWIKLQDTQLWKWDCGRLVSKADNTLVAEVEKKTRPLELQSSCGLQLRTQTKSGG